MRAYFNKFCSSLSPAEPEMDTKCRVAGVDGSSPKFSKTVAVGGWPGGGQTQLSRLDL